MTWPFGRNKTPDGTTVIRHEKVESRLGFTAESTEGFVAAREAAYKQVFGEAAEVSHELIPLVPHIDVYRHQQRIAGRDVCTLVTGGMSDLPMILPRGAQDMPRRVELIFYCDAPKAEYIATLRWLAHFPHNAKSCLGYGHTVPNGDPPEPFWGSDVLDTILFLAPIVNKHQTLHEQLTIGGDPVHFLWVVPLTTAECHYKLKHGIGAMLDLFDKHRHPFLFDRARKSYV
jgi:hypothetical protein